MIESLPVYTEKTPAQTALETISQIDPKIIVTLGGMLSLTVMFCVGCVAFTGSDMTLSSHGFSITHPAKSK